MVSYLGANNWKRLRVIRECIIVSVIVLYGSVYSCLSRRFVCLGTHTHTPLFFFSFPSHHKIHNALAHVLFNIVDDEPKGSSGGISDTFLQWLLVV